MSQDLPEVVTFKLGPKERVGVSKANNSTWIN